MSTNFYEAFLRHASDAKKLLDDSRFANADHLFGLAAECALKALLLQQGIPADDGDIHKNYKQYRKHINTLWDDYQIYMQTRCSYVIPNQNPFQDWDISQRYAPEGTITEETAKNHGTAVDTVMDVIKKAQLDGVIP